MSNPNYKNPNPPNPINSGLGVKSYNKAKKQANRILAQAAAINSSAEPDSDNSEQTMFINQARIKAQASLALATLTEYVADMESGIIKDDKDMGDIYSRIKILNEVLKNIDIEAAKKGFELILVKEIVEN